MQPSAVQCRAHDSLNIYKTASPPQVLSSLVQPPEDSGDPDAAQYYAAQSVMYQRVAVGVPGAGGRRPGSVKKQYGTRDNTFGSGHK